MMQDIPRTPRDISWLSFNYRVLQEAKDPTVPLLERLKFLAIYSSNLDEFFRVRVANIRNLKEIKRQMKTTMDFEPRDLLKEIHKTVNRQQEEFSLIFEQEIVPELARHHIFLRRRLDLSKPQTDFVEHYFHENLLPFVMPVLLVRHRIRPFLANASLYLAVHLRPKKRPLAESEYALVRIPTDQLPRFIELPSAKDRHELIMLDDIVRNSVYWLFPGYDIQDTYSIKLTRDAELYIDDEFSGDLVQKIKESLQKRLVGPPSRFVYDREMPGHLLEYLQDTFDLGKYDILPEGRYHNNFDFFRFPDFGLTHLKHKPLPPLPHPRLEQASSPFDLVRSKDQMVHTPYQGYQAVIRFFEHAAEDPDVTHIKITHYRVAAQSKIMRALMNAVERGKQVSVFVEIKARFDEAANLEWGERLEKAGVRVHYSFPGVKVHAKLGLIRRVEGHEARLYAYLATGNFNEQTAPVYGDMGIFTAHTELCEEVSAVFTFLENVKPPRQAFKHLLVGKFNLRSDLEGLIEREIAAAKKKKPASMVLKMNSLEDPQMINRLYKASKAGVKIKLIIRGICCIVPGIPGLSDNIEIVSIVDRFLEHARIFVFHNGGNPLYYLSSADFMERNLSHRIETCFPVLDPDLKAEIQHIIDLQLADNVKARVIDRFDQNLYKRTSSDVPVRAQIDSYYFYKRQQDKA